MNAPRYAWFVWLGIILSFFIVAYVYAEPISDCTYVPRQSDEVIVTCGSLKAVVSSVSVYAGLIMR
jgi:hypothetical protein